MQQHRMALGIGDPGSETPDLDRRATLREPTPEWKHEGRRLVARLAEAGIYAQLRGDAQAATLDLAQIERTLSLWTAMVNFSQWSRALESSWAASAGWRSAR